MSNTKLLEGRYNLLRVLGGGGMGVVHEGYDTLLDRPVAIKVLSESSSSRLGSAGRTRLLHEAQSAAKLNHPNIVSIFDAGQDQDISYIVMELVEGNSLLEHKGIPIGEVISIGKQISAALEHAHQHGIIHRDIKPENVLITPAGVVKLTDFGLARSFASRISLDGMVVGTVFYMAPEAALSKQTDARVDLYSLGVLLYELVAGVLPFSADDPLAVISQHLYAPVIPPRAHNSEIPVALDALIVQLLSKQPENRPGSAAEVRQLLKIIESAMKEGTGITPSPEYTLLDRIVRGRLVGRERELSQMSALWRQAVSGQGSVLLVSGEPGIGKTRLARELIAQGLISGGRVMSGACYAEGGIPYAPFPQIIREAFESENAWEDIPRYILADLIQVSPDLRPKYPEIYPNPPLEPQSEQQRNFDSIATWLTAQCTQTSLLLFIDDVHWADSGTLALIRHLSRRAPQLRLLILMTYRETELDELGPLQAVLHDLNRERLSTRIKLTRFDRLQSRALLASILSPHGEVDEVLLDKIYYETEGNPFFLEEVCKALIEDGKLCYENNLWTAVALDEIEIPQSVRTTLQTRLARLPEQTQEILRCAAVLGRQFDTETLRKSCSIDEEEMIVALESAERAQIIAEVPQKHSPSMRFAFAHTLIPTTLTEQLSGLRRQRLHKNAAQAIVAVHPDDYEALGYHFERGGNGIRAREYYVKAGDRALGRYANQEAERYYRAALTLDDTVEESSQVFSSLGEALFRQSRYEEAGEVWDRALVSYCLAGDKDHQAYVIARKARAAWYQGHHPEGLEICRMGIASLGDYMEQETPGVATLIHETARAAYFNELHDEALQMCQRALTLARHLELVDVQAETLATMGILPNQSYEDAKEALVQAVELSESAGLLAPAVRAHANLGSHLQLKGDLIAAREHFLRSREIAARLGIPDWEHSMLTGVVDICFLLGDLNYIETVFAELTELIKRIPNPEIALLFNRFIEARMHRFQGEWEEALPEMIACSEEAKRRGLFNLAAGINIVLAELLLEQNDPYKSEKILMETIQFGSAAHDEDRAIANMLLSAVYTREGELAEARRMIEETRPKIAARSFFGGEAYLLWSEGLLASAEGNWDAAFSFFGSLDGMTEQLSIPWYQGRVLADWAQAHLQRGTAEDIPLAESLYNRSIKIFQKLRLPRYVNHVKKSSSRLPRLEFHISRQARDRYQFDESIYSLTGNVVFANFHAARLFAQKMNQKRDLIQFPETTVRGGQINALGLVDEILHLVIAQYRQQRNPRVIEQAMEWVYDQVGREAVDATIKRFTEEFPPVSVYRREETVDEYLSGESAGVPHSFLVLEELLMLWITNLNPACSSYDELFDDTNLEKITSYKQIGTALGEFFDTQPFFGPDNQNLIDMLHSPAEVVPHSLPGQLEYIRTRWGGILGQYIYRLLTSLDLIKEEEKIDFSGLGSPPAKVLEFGGLELEAERFSPDQEWMPNLVLIAKNAYVWLDQLSKKYQRSVSGLDEIPEQELKFLAESGITGLWLIGLWERSQASRRIKQLRGNPDAEASAYSLFSYDIAGDLGGEEAYQGLRQRAWQHGIRLASDMVPNHMGIDSPWVIEHPQWFVSLDFSPFPVYSFNGPDFSWDPQVGIYLEDHYYDNSDAAVVFKRIDRRSGDVKHIYHGNDGTSMPWNDTAQLNYLNPDVREAVIQTIIHVARKFPIIRFDAAMTLAKRHFQRLWYPEPGSGGDIPSRAGHGMPKVDFDTAMPGEFWREVVDRVAQEAPGTLLLAEAFWLMEGYFVRTLGMHRVYNSAFMNMLRDEKNQEYRLVIKNTLEFDPEILKRYVNFMSNPDERTSVEQFGKGDKYFGICTMLATLPGLPMFGHGQIEGFTEKYGMEYRRAYWDEQLDSYLIERHQREIFPLLRQRYLFAEARDFLLYDFFTPEGSVNEDVFAYSNRSGDERALVIYHNKYASARGWIRSSVAYLDKFTGSADGGEPALVQKTLGEGLGLRDDPGRFTLFRDGVSGLEYIRQNQEFMRDGYYIELGAYQYHVFTDFRQVRDNAWGQYNQLNQYLNGRGVPSIDGALTELFLQAVRHPYREIINPGFIRWIQTESAKVRDWDAVDLQIPVLDDLERRTQALLDGVRSVTNSKSDLLAITHSIRREVTAIARLADLVRADNDPIGTEAHEAIAYLRSTPLDRSWLSLEDSSGWGILLTWAVTRRLGEVSDPVASAELSRSWIDEWQLGKIGDDTVRGLGGENIPVSQLLKLLTTHQELGDWQTTPLVEDEPKAVTKQLLESWLRDTDLQRYLGYNRYQGTLWYSREAFNEWLWWTFTCAVIRSISGKDGLVDPEGIEEINRLYAVIHQLRKAAESSGYQVGKLLD